MFRINDWISRDSKVLDLGCGDGSLLNDLRIEKSASGLGIEIDAEKIKSCLEKESQLSNRTSIVVWKILATNLLIML